jgi:hypothetical protein
MGCNESREDKKLSSVYSLKTPLPLHIYQYSTTSSHSTPKSSPTNQSLTPKSPTSKLPTPKTHLSRLNSIAHFKFPMFREFQPNVKQEILLHIDKELRKL